MLRGGRNEKEADELLPPLHAQQDPDDHEAQLPSQRGGPGAPGGAKQSGRGEPSHKCTQSVGIWAMVRQHTFMVHLKTQMT